MRRLMLLAVAALALGAGGCGGDGGGAGESAELAPADTFVYALIDSDFEAEGWDKARDLLERFPDGDQVLARALAELDAEDIDFRRDVEPALGPEVAVVVLRPQTGEDPPVVFLTQPDDPAKLTALLERSEDDVVQAEVDGWTAVAESEAHIDAVREGEGSLSESDAFEDAMDRLSDDALARIFVNGDAARSLALQEEELPPDQRALAECFADGGGGGSTAIGIAAAEEGVRIEGAAEAGEPELEEGQSTLSDRLPGDALAFVSVRGLGERMRQALRCVSDGNEEVAQQIAAAELGLGVSIEEDVLPLFAGETAVAVYGADPMPSVVVATEVEDEGRALRTLDRITERASAFLGGFRVEELELEGFPTRRLMLEGGTEFLYAVGDGRLVAASSEATLTAALRGDGALASDPDFERAENAAGIPDETAAIVYADIDAAVELAVGTLTPEGDEADEAVRNLEPLRSLFFWADADGDWAKFEGLLEIE